MGQGASPPPGQRPSPFEATRQPSSGRPETEDLRPNPLTGNDCALKLWRMPGFEKRGILAARVMQRQSAGA